MARVIAIGDKLPENMLQGLKRLTGLDFDTPPRSLLKAPVGDLTLATHNSQDEKKPALASRQHAQM